MKDILTTPEVGLLTHSAETLTLSILLNSTRAGDKPSTWPQA